MPSVLRTLSRRTGAWPALVALVLPAAGLPSHAADEGEAGGTFSTPGYPQRNVQPGPGFGTGSTPGLQQGPINGRPGANGRGSNTFPGTAGNPPGTRRAPNDAFPRRLEPAPP